MSDKSVMMEAEGLVNGQRAQAYGHPKENFERICLLWNAYLDGRPGGIGGWITEKDHAIMMILVKIARLQETPDHRDSLVDICGYAGTYEKLLAREQAEAAERDTMYQALAEALEAERAVAAEAPLATAEIELCDALEGNSSPCRAKDCWTRAPMDEGVPCGPIGSFHLSS